MVLVLIFCLSHIFRHMYKFGQIYEILDSHHPPQKTDFKFWWNSLNFTAFFTKIDKKKLANFSNNSMQFIFMDLATFFKISKLKLIEIERVSIVRGLLLNMENMIVCWNWWGLLPVARSSALWYDMFLKGYAIQCIQGVWYGG